MIASRLLAELAGDRLRLAPTDRVSGGLLDAVGAAKPEIIQALRQEAYDGERATAEQVPPAQDASGRRRREPRSPE